jgi:hypothetical protein
MKWPSESTEFGEAICIANGSLEGGQSLLTTFGADATTGATGVKSIWFGRVDLKLKRR